MFRGGDQKVNNFVTVGLLSLFNCPSQNWKKRWFTLYRLDPFNPTSMEISYYADSECKEKKGTINVTKISKVSPISGKTKDHIFSIETTDGKKLVMKAADARTKNIWLAKLLEGCSKGGSLSLSWTHTFCIADIYIGCCLDTVQFELCTIVHHVR